MNKRVAIIISPNYKDYAKKYLDDCIDSLRKQDWQGKMKIFITDNETSKESYQYLKDKLPEAQIHCNQNNDGFAKGNNDAIRLAMEQKYDYILLFNMDTIIEPSCLREMVKVVESDKKIGAVQARLMLYPEKDKINSLGNTTHFLGFGYSLGYREKYTKANRLHSPEPSGTMEPSGVNDIHYPSGAGVLFTREVLEKVGLYDKEYWMYNEDQEHGWRIWLAGYKCVLAPKAVVYHKYKFAKSIKQYYWMDRNRIITVVKSYHWLTLLLITPACIIMELGLLLFSLKTGWFKEKLRVWKYFFIPSTWRYLIKARRQSQGLRKVKDSDIVNLITGRIWYQEIDDVKLRLINPIFDFYWRICKFIIIW